MMPQLPMDCTTPTRARRLHVKHHLADKFALRSINSAPNMDEHNNVLNTGTCVCVCMCVCMHARQVRCTDLLVRHERTRYVSAYV